MYLESPKILRKILLGYDVLFFDIFGVLWDGKSEMVRATEVLRFLRKNGKIVFLISNIPNRSENLEKGYFSGTGLTKGDSYDTMVTSGDVMLDALSNGLGTFSGNGKPKNCYVLGKLRLEDFVESAGCTLVNSPKEADFVYLGFPQISLGESKGLDRKYENSIFESDMYEETYFDVTDVDIFAEKILECRKYNLPMLSDCADPVAPQAKRGTSEIHYVLRQGTIANRYREIGGQVVEICKPNSVIYSYALKKLRETFGYDDLDLAKRRMIMVGDTIETDILGASNATRDLAVRIDSMLVLGGVSGRNSSGNSNAMAKLCRDRNLDLHYMVNGLSIHE
jgi:HAD superfamily hydrolase (TIGR01450 family)